MTPTRSAQATAATGDEQNRQVEYDIIIEILRAGDERLPRAELERRLAHVEPLVLGDALDRLRQRARLRLDGETVEGCEVAERRYVLNLLAAVVVHLLVSASPRVLSVEEVARDCERDLSQPDEREEVELALRWLRVDELACRRDGGWAATRPAVRAHELSF